MMYVTKSMNTEFNAIMSRRSNPKSVMICRILKSGKPGKPYAETLYGSETTAQDVINRLEAFNPGSHWVEA